MDERRLRSASQERAFARRVSGTVQPGSGSGWKRRQDVRHEIYLFEMKRTDGKALNLKVADLEQLHRHAVMEGRIPAMHLELGGRRYVLVEEGDFVTISGCSGVEGSSPSAHAERRAVGDVSTVPPARRRRRRTVGHTGE